MLTFEDAAYTGMKDRCAHRYQGTSSWSFERRLRAACSLASDSQSRPELAWPAITLSGTSDSAATTDEEALSGCSSPARLPEGSREIA